MLIKHYFRFNSICKKTKSHKSPDWSRLVRQKLDEWDGESNSFFFIRHKPDLSFNGKSFAVRFLNTFGFGSRYRKTYFLLLIEPILNHTAPYHLLRLAAYEEKKLVHSISGNDRFSHKLLNLFIVKLMLFRTRIFLEIVSSKVLISSVIEQPLSEAGQPMLVNVVGTSEDLTWGHLTCKVWCD